MGKPFTGINDMKGEDHIDLWRKHNRVEHCFRTINNIDIIFAVYQRIPQEIKVHVFMFPLAYLFLALICNRIKAVDEDVSPVSVRDILNFIRIQYILSGKGGEEKN